jgi:hypothetical protein
MLFQMSYKDKVQRTGFVEAGTLQKAEELGRKWCEGRDGVRFIGIRDAVLVREEAAKPVEPQKAWKVS